MIENMINESNMDPGFILLVIVFFFVFAIISLSPIIFIILLIRYVIKKSHKETEKYFEMSQQRENEHMRQIQDELDIKKMKFKRKKCIYCGSLNEMTESNCKNCGAMLKEI